jgi:hypothetical protein
VKSTTLKLQFPPQAVQNLKPGDRITMGLGFSKGSRQQGSVR